jgi:hypothetical protein
MNIPDGLYDIEPAKSNDSDISWKLIYDTDPDLFDYYFILFPGTHTMSRVSRQERKFAGKVSGTNC